MKLIGETYNIRVKGISRKFGIYECPICRKHFEANYHNVNGGKTTKCRSCSVTIRNTTHGLSKHPLFRIFNGMKQRCYNKSNQDYCYYGADGVTISADWLNDFKLFYDWSIENGWEHGLTIDRIESTGMYEPTNCRFITIQEQQKNRRLIFRSNTTGHSGVYPGNRAYVAQVCFDNKQVYVGTYATIELASMARDEFILKNNIKKKLNCENINA